MPTMPGAPTQPRTKGDERWEQWVAKGVAHDADVRHRAKMLVLLAVSIAALVLALTLGLD